MEFKIYQINQGFPTYPTSNLREDRTSGPRVNACVFLMRNDTFLKQIGDLLSRCWSHFYFHNDMIMKAIINSNINKAQTLESPIIPLKSKKTRSICFMAPFFSLAFSALHSPSLSQSTFLFHFFLL